MQYVGVADSNNPPRQLALNSDGSINATTTGTSTVAGTVAVSSVAGIVRTTATSLLGITLDEVADTTTGTIIDFGAPVAVAVCQIQGTATLTGTFGSEFSMDGLSWFPGTAPAALTAASKSYTLFTSVYARQWRVNFTKTGGTGTVSAKLSGY